MPCMSHCRAHSDVTAAPSLHGYSRSSCRPWSYRLQCSGGLRFSPRHCENTVMDACWIRDQLGRLSGGMRLLAAYPPQAHVLPRCRIHHDPGVWYPGADQHLHRSRLFQVRSRSVERTPSLAPDGPAWSGSRGLALAWGYWCLGAGPRGESLCHKGVEFLVAHRGAVDIAGQCFERVHPFEIVPPSADEEHFIHWCSL